MSDKNRFIPTEDGLSFSKKIAESLGISFDREATRKHSYNLLEHYFEEISLVLPNETRGCHFENFASRDFMAFAEQGKNSPIINVDEQWQMFLFCANSIVCIQAFFVLNQKKRDRNAALFKENLETFSNPYGHEILREKMKPLFIEHVEALPLANSLTACMFGFMLCHELAHHNLGHLNSIQTKQQELDADIKGFEYFVQLNRQHEKLKFLEIHPDLLFAPVLAMTYLHALEKLGIISTESISHPSGNQRIQNLYVLFNKVASEKAHSLYDGFRLSTEELMEEIS